MEPGTLVRHMAYSDFRAEVVGFKDAKTANVKVISGWRGMRVPTWPVSIPRVSLLVVEEKPRA